MTSKGFIEIDDSRNFSFRELDEFTATLNSAEVERVLATARANAEKTYDMHGARDKSVA